MVLIITIAPLKNLGYESPLVDPGNSGKIATGLKSVFTGEFI
jgi:hypothetical protein